MRFFGRGDGRGGTWRLAKHGAGFHGFKLVEKKETKPVQRLADSELLDLSRQEQRKLRRHGGEGSRSMTKRLKRERRRRNTWEREGRQRAIPKGQKLVGFHTVWSSRASRDQALLHAISAAAPETTKRSFVAICGAKVQHRDDQQFDTAGARACTKCKKQVTEVMGILERSAK